MSANKEITIRKPSILDFDAVAESESDGTLMLQNPDGTDTGLEVTLLGDNADVVQKHVNKTIRALRAKEELAKKSGKPVEFDLEKINEQNVESCAIRATGWVGVDEPFDRELFKRALRRNPHWVAQIVEYSGNMANFTKKPLTT